ncbi:carboxypeptidase regulatory-like domain-containing protein [Stieleria sp. ICT_E10.1]|uniref:carboxypeptidase regulatory-like domain-containing protein n=1 Tax=Stieleria sedimenti TaxID=2976331 RepID=UPI00217F7458|nr:carboxypeptidase regulatory-like domain-containing protein [Stieleria sedimenti]MCS7466509.1 carboxypeptidase regulatory-like domain-containing protein [Stieleria sedimenti]
MNHWLIDGPLSLCVVVVVQVAIVSAIAWLVASRIKRVDAGRTYAVWLTAVCLTLAILPAHLLVGGWRIPLASAGVDLAIGSVATPPIEGQLNVPAMQDNPVMPSVAGSIESEKPTDRTSQTRPNRLSHAPATAARPVSGFPETELRQTVGVVDQTSVAAAFRSGGAAMLILLACAYTIGFALVALRLLAGMIRLRNAASKGQRVSGPIIDTADDIARTIGLCATPSILRTDRTSMPLVFGLFRSVILVPTDFETWDDHEIRSTLLHELMHVRRHDSVGQLLASVNLMVYWFHPAVWLVDRRLTESREWATDRDVMEKSSTMDSELTSGRYAESLLNIVTRFRAADATRRLPDHAAIAMSRHTEIEDRLRLILGGVPGLSRWRIATLRLMVAMLAVAAVATTVRLDRSVAQEASDEDGKPAVSDAVQAAADDSAPMVEPIRPEDNDLIARVLQCEVLTAEGDDYAVLVNASGKVLAPDGQPVTSATVVLRESSGRRVSSDLEKYYYSADRKTIRVSDVIARIETNANGEFEFSAVKAPALRNDAADRWSGSLVAVFPGLGVDAIPLMIEKANPAPIRDLELKLESPRSISGRFVTPDGEPLAGAIVDVVQLFTPSSTLFERQEQFELSRSQLTPRTLTDATGRFQFTNLPAGQIASIQASHDHWEDGYIAVRTSDDVALGKLQRPNSWLSSGEVVASPATVVADPGYTLHGRVIDQQGSPIAEVSVYPSSSVYRFKTDSDGEFRCRISTLMVQRYLDRDDRPMKFSVVPPQHGPSMPTQLELSSDQLTGKKPIDVTLSKAATISGKVVDASGSPLEGIWVRSLDGPASLGATSDADGTYRLKLPKGEHFLAVATRDAGYAIPSYSKLIVLTKEEAESLPHQKITISDHTPRELEPIVVPKLSTYQVIVSLPDGKPAVGASVILRDEIPPSPNAPEFDRTPHIVEKSETETTNSLGRATLVPNGITSSKAFIDVKYLNGDSAFDGMVKLSEAKDGVVHLVLNSSAIVEGRVLVDGEPVAGARVQVSLTKPVQRTANGRTMMFYQSSGHQFVTTNSEGVYRASVPAGKRVSVSLSSVPNLSVRSGIGYYANPDGDGKLIVKDFELIRGDQAIAGRVIDADGNPVAKAMVSIRRDRDVVPNFWVDHDRESQSTTDANGRFHLKNVPQGNYQLMVRGPRGASSVSTTRISTMVPVSTGEMNLEITLNLPSAPAIPRLVPIEITPKR